MDILKKTVSFRAVSILVLASFVATSVMPPQAFAQALNLPAPGAMVGPSATFEPVLMKGLKVHPENPLLFDFILDSGKTELKSDSPELRAESQKLIKYFLASLTIKEDDLWVNLSPYEKDRMLTDELGKTELGRDMLAQDYILKQLTASLIYPEKELGKSFWERIYTRAREEFGTTDIPVDTFNKVWITADKAKVFEHKDTAYVVDAHLKVMLESDYLAENKTSAVSSQRSAENAGASDNKDARELSKQLLREVVLPEIEKEVNEGANFAPVRQMFYSMIMASWYKLALKDALLNQVYSNKSKTGGVLTDDPAVKEKIYEQYLAAYKKGVFNYIKEEPDAVSQQAVPHKYFSGGLKVFTGDPAQIIERLKELPERYRFELVRQLNKTLMASVQVAGTVAGSSEEVQEALGIGAEYRKNGNIPKAIVSFRRAIELAPNNAFAHASLGMAYKDEGNLNLGADQLSIAARLDPVYKIQYQTLYAAQLIVAGEFGRAVDNLQEAIKSHEKEFPSNVYAMAHAYLAIGLYAAGDRKAALEEYKVALEQAPFNEELSGLVSRSGRPSLSARFTAFLRALKHKPAIKSLPSVEQQAAAVEQNIRGLVDQLQTGYSLKVMPTSTGALLVEMTQSYLPGSKSVLKTVRDNYRDIATQVSPSARVKVISADAYSLKFEISDAAMLEYRYQGGLDYTIQAVLSTVRDVFQQSSQNAHVSIMWNQTVYVGYEIAVVENVSQLEGLPQLLKAELSKVPSDEFPANTPLSVLLARDPATGMVTNIEIAPFNYHNIIGTLNFHGGLLVQTQEAGQALYYSFGVMAADDQHEAYTIDWDSKTNQNRLVIDTSVPLDEARRQQLFDEITGFIPALLSHKKIVNMADVKAKLADLLGVQDAAMLADKFIVSPRSAVQSIVSTLNGASLNWFDDRKLPVYLYGWAGQDIGREIAQATTADWRNGFVDLSAKLQESLVNAHGDVPLFMVELETGDRVPLIHSVKIRVLQYSDMLSALNDQNSLYVSVSAEQGKMPSKYQFRVAAANEQHPDGTTDWDSRELTGTVYIDTNVPVGQLDRQGLFDKIMALVRVKVDTKAYENIARMETRLAGFLGVPVLREAIRVAEGKVKYLHIKALARQGEDKPVELEEARQELARGRFQYGGDVVYVGEMSPAARQDSVISAVQAGLIPALGLEYQTREARGITNTTATLAQIVRRGGGDAVAAVKAGADVLLASGMLTRQDVADARAAAEAMGKKVVIIVGADAKRRDVMAAIQMAAVVKADGIRLMSAAATPEQAGKTRDIVKWAKQNHPDLLLMVEDGVTTENRDIVGEGVKAGVTPQSSAEIKAIANLGHTAFKSDAAMTASADVALQTVNARKIVSAYQTKYPGVSVPTEMTARIAGKTYSLVLTGPSKDILRTSAKSMNLNYFVELVNGDGRKYTAAFSVELNTVDGQFKVAGRTVSGKDDERKTTEERAIEQWLKGIDTWTTAGIPLSTTVTIAGKELDAQYVAGALAQMGQDVAAGQGGTSEATGARRLSFTALAEYAKQYPDGEFVLLINDLEAYLKDQFPAANVGALVDMDAKVGSILWGHQADGEGILGAVQQWAAATTAEANSAIAVDKAMINTERSTLSIAPAVLAQKVALQGVELSVRDWIYAIDAIAGSMAYVPLSANKKITLAAVGAYDTVREGIKIVERVARLLVAKVKDLDLSLSTRNVSAGGFNEQKQVLELVVSGDLAKFSLNIVKRQAALTGKRDEIMQWIGGLAEEFEAAVPELRGWFTNTQDSAMSGAGFINPLYMPGHKMNAIRDWLEKKAVKVDGADVHFIVVENDEEVIHVKSETVTRDSKEVIDCTIAIPPERLSHQGYSGQVALSILSAINEHFVRQIFDLRKDEKELATDLMDQEPKDSAMKAPGGIDLNAKKMGLDVTRDGKGVDIKFDPAQVAEFQKGNFTGVQGIILRIVPVASPLQLLGLETEPSPDQLARG